MPTIISEKHSEKSVNVKGIVSRILSHLPDQVVGGLNEVAILDSHDQNSAFASYSKENSRIEIYLEEILSWQPWVLKKTYIFPYLTVGIALGHELDHHVNRNNEAINHERSAENNAFKYVYPSLGIFKPIAKLLGIILKK